MAKNGLVHNRVILGDRISLGIRDKYTIKHLFLNTGTFIFKK